jgi:hypothetical protein
MHEMLYLQLSEIIIFPMAYLFDHIPFDVVYKYPAHAFRAKQTEEFWLVEHLLCLYKIFLWLAHVP